MKRTLVTARLLVLLPLLLFLLLTAGSLGCKAAALPLSAPVAAVMAEEGLTAVSYTHLDVYKRQVGDGAVHFNRIAKRKENKQDGRRFDF